MNPLAAVGRTTLLAVAAIGRITLFTLSAIVHIFRAPFYPRQFGLALVQIGWLSLPVVGLTSLFTGGALV
ncbi:MAG: ABC transporter permease, partial [Sulfitobacter sp. SK025]